MTYDTLIGPAHAAYAYAFDIFHVHSSSLPTQVHAQAHLAGNRCHSPADLS
ncbi:hypothetical protein IMZ48_06255 [Candidatus Bathyarchaeota archaeon]|nr:hypothetical protein [Candidatus Bathyarchaeota archaeon]